ncbi:hypothetical protein CLV43_119114 [Umezawaea tangerina]|uniref:Uncharacterized protein n=1 Tax=Umezawaea tangerina TaxID=84725 RepID=A0A2T0SK66_9PSEU|nr:hypothetical protein CLV43_119114 [Umezawaea tangerina]
MRVRTSRTSPFFGTYTVCFHSSTRINGLGWLSITKSQYRPRRNLCESYFFFSFRRSASSSRMTDSTKRTTDTNAPNLMDCELPNTTPSRPANPMRPTIARMTDDGSSRRR